MERTRVQRLIAQGSLREFENDGDNLDRYYLPGRELIIPGELYLIPDNAQLRTYNNKLNEILLSLGLRERRTVIIPDSDYLLDLAIAQNLSLLKKHLDLAQSYRVYPYAVTAETMSWIIMLKDQGYRIEPAFPQRKYFDDLSHPSHRGGWGRWVGEPERESFPERFNIPYPISWIGQGLGQVIEAYERVVNQSGTQDAFFKPIFSAGGFTLAKISSLDDLRARYSTLKSQGALDFDGQEIPVEIQSFVHDIQGLYSLQYQENGELITPRGFSKQVVENNQWQGNVFNGEMPDTELMQIWQNFKRGYRQYGSNFGWGGIDLVKTETGRWLILEHNGLRITGAHPAIFLARELGVINQPFATLKSPGEVNCDLETLWDVLKSNHLAFDPQKKRGIFPLVWFPGSGMLWATGDNCFAMLEEAYNILVRENYVICQFFD